MVNHTSKRSISLHCMLARPCLHYLLMNQLLGIASHIWLAALENSFYLYPLFFALSDDMLDTEHNAVPLHLHRTYDSQDLDLALADMAVFSETNVIVLLIF